MNVFLFTTQTKLAIMQTQITYLTNTIKLMQDKIDELLKDMDSIKRNSAGVEPPSIYDAYFTENALEPQSPSTLTDTQFVMIPSADIDANDADSESDSGSEYDSEY